MANYHVTRRAESELWTVVREGSERASATASTQAEAERLAKEYSRNSGGGEVRIHRPNGQIRDSDTVAPGNESTTIDKRH